MSLYGKKWLILNENQDQETFQKVLENRKLLEVKDIPDFYDPFLFKGMEKSILRIKNAIANNEKIVVFGDYDVDGISAATILVKTLKKINADVICRLPNRVNDGYGLSIKFIDSFIEEKASLVITVDCGISCIKEVEHASANNIDVIITDHHTIPETLPEKAHAILHPKLDDIYPYKELTGAGVALKLAQAIIQEYKIDDEKLKDEIVNLATLGTVADLGILQDENRLIVKKGLKNMVNTSSAGLKRIMELAEIKDNYELDTHAIGFKIAPRINAAGRIGDPYVALKLLLLDDYDESAITLGNELEDLNSKRKNITEEILKQTEIMFGDKENLPCVLIAENADWHIGVLGLVAGRMAEKYGRPSIAMQDFGETLVGSARSIRGFNITDALSNISDVLISFGGHAKAAGFNLEKKNLEAFKEKLIAYSEKTLDKDTITPILEIDCELKEQDMTFDFLNKIEDLKPYGVGNEDPIFHVSNIEPHFVSTVGKENSHLKFTVYYGGKTIQVIGFYMGQFAEQIRQHKKIDLACHMDKNTWQSKTYIQFRVVDIRGTE